MRRGWCPVGCLGAAFVGLAISAAAAPRTDVHPDVDPATPCDVCHAEITPEVHRRWLESDHGQLAVKCFVCHGSTGSDFRLEPDPERCLGCHAEQVASLDRLKRTTCFGCHDPHRLNPHMAAVGDGGGGAS